MSDRAEAEKPTTDAPAEGERRAQRGYVSQYDLAARVIYQALAAGRLQWIGVADRSAGAFDDLVLGLRDRIVAYQIKSSRDPEPFSIRTILLGGGGLLGRMLESRRKLCARHPDVLIETVYVCDDYPRTNDAITTGGQGLASAAFLRTHEARRLSWTLADWQASPFSGFIEDVRDASRLDDRAFESAWRHTRFLVAGQGRSLGLGEDGHTDQRRLRELAALLPRLAADPADQDRWPLAELLSRLSWRDPFGLRHGHTFPVDGLYQSNAPTHEALQQILLSITSGYISLIGPPGTGKSTLLATGLLPTPRAMVVRYLAFVPDEGQGLGRAEAFDFLNDIVAQLKRQNLGVQVVPGTELAELRAQFEALLREASERFRREEVRTVIVIDGLDHVPREERPQHSFLRELPLPHALPEGIVFLLGTQRLDLEGIPPAVSDQAKEQGRCVVVTPLPREAVARLANAAGVPDDVDRDALYARSGGHPLSTRYVIEGLLAAHTPEDRTEWLRRGPAYGGDVEVFYQRAWRDLEYNSEAQRALAFVALAEGPLTPVSLDGLVGCGATDAAWRAAGHLLVRDHRHAWSIFHNSFRLFLRVKTGLRHGVTDDAAVRRRYSELADMARDADLNDPQCWMELRYRARAGDHCAVADLARPERFRTQFIEGRDPGDIHDDVDLAFAAARALRRPELVVDLILSRHEITLRSEALGDAVFDALIQLGERHAALGLIGATDVSLTVGKGYELVDAFLAAREAGEARRLFEDLEPIANLLGAQAIEGQRAEHDVLFKWAERALVFREPAQILASLARLRPPVDPLGYGFDIEDYRNQLKLVAARGHLMRNPDLTPEWLMPALQIGLQDRGLLFFFAAQASFEANDHVLAGRHLQEALVLANELEPDFRRESAAIAARVTRLDLAATFFEGVAPPTLAGLDIADGAEGLRRASREIITHYALAARLDHPVNASATPQSRLLATYQRRLETIGRLLGEGRRGRTPSAEPLREFEVTLDFLQRAVGDRQHDSDRWYLDQVMDEAVAAMVDAAAAFGPETLAQFLETMDARLVGDADRLGQSRVRRAYAMAAFRHERDASRAERRLAYQPGLESSPDEQLAETARTASTLAVFGLSERARALLFEGHGEGLGYSLPAKKDPQYIVWRELLVRACDEDPAGRPDRLQFFARLLAGMTETEGRGAAQRLAPAFLGQAAQAGSPWARIAADLVEDVNLAAWPDLAQGLLAGVIKRNPALTAAAGVVLGRVVLPFSGDRDQSMYPKLIRAAPDNQLGRMLDHAVICLETDGHLTRRILFLEEIAEAAADRGLAHGTDALARWRAELPPPRSGSSPEDPFFLVRTLEGITDVMKRRGDGIDRWGAVHAFERIAPRSDYAAAKALFDSIEILQGDERALDTMAKAAHAAGQRADAVSCLARLERLAAERGGWGDGISGSAKQRYHRLNVLLNGETARHAAFDAFVDDLANRRPYVGYLSPGLVSVLELLSPRPTWAQSWARLQDHLSRFREYRMGQDLGPVPEGPDADEHTLADILFRAIDTTTMEPTRMARAAAIELTQTHGGDAVVAALLPRLWHAGGYHALEAAQIAWECRDVAAVRESVLGFLTEMCDSDDFAVRRIALSLALGWGQTPGTKSGDLPAIYELELPPSWQVERFDPPSGSSPTSAGLYTEDAYAWTWPLEAALTLTATATGLDLANLRVRVAQLMSRMGGTAAFGPDAAARQQRRLRRLSLLCTHRKLIVSAACQAMRELIGELVAAEAIDPRLVPFILQRASAFPSNVSTLPPRPDRTACRALR